MQPTAASSILIERLREKSPVASGAPLFGSCRLTVGRTLGGEEDFGKVWSVLWLDDQRLLVADLISPPFFKILDAEADLLLHAFGPAGEGPSEFQAPSSVFRSVTRPGALEVYDIENERISLFDEGGMVESPGYLGEIPFRVQTIVVELKPYRDRYVGVGRMADHTLLVVDSTGRAVRKLATDPPFDLDETGGSRVAAELLNGAYLDGEGSQLALAYIQKPLIDLIDLEQDAYLRVTGPRPAPIDFQVRNGSLLMDRSSVGSYLGVAVTERLVFALFNGRTQAEQLEAAQTDPDNGTSRLIQVFDWDGRYLTEFEMERGIVAMEVSPDHRHLWTDYTDPFPFVAEWPLPPITGLLDRLEQGERASDLELCPDGVYGG